MTTFYLHVQWLISFNIWLDYTVASVFNCLLSDHLDFIVRSLFLLFLDLYFLDGVALNNFIFLKSGNFLFFVSVNSNL
jgi:hypothetical protein